MLPVSHALLAQGTLRHAACWDSMQQLVLHLDGFMTEPIQTIRVGAPSAAPSKVPLFRVTRKTFLAFGALMLVFVLYYSYVTFRILDFSGAAGNYPPNWCPAATWNNILSSAQMFGVIQLNPTASYTAYATQAAVWCKQMINAAGYNYSANGITPNITITLPTTSVSTSSTSVTVKGQLPLPH